MTTIVYRNNILASDSLGIQNNTTKLPGTIQKLWCLKDGTLVGGSGDTQSIIFSIQNANSVLEIKSKSEYDNNEIICILSNLTILQYCKQVWCDMGKPEFYSIGSGAPFAYGALHQGATAEEAVLAASKMDPFTDDRIQKIKLGDKIKMPISTSIIIDKKKSSWFWSK